MILHKHYNRLVEKKQISYDKVQFKILDDLENLRKQLEKHNKFKFFKKNHYISGIYIYGEVGRGKSLLMDLFFEHCNITKKRIHFHEYLISVHKELHILRKTKPNLKDPLKHIAKKFAKSFSLLCFDEFHVTDVADAMILEHLFRYLFKYKVIIVTTSNRHPKELYEGGIQREKYLEFVTYLTSKMLITKLLAKCDYRSKFIANLDSNYIYPINKINDKKIANLFAQLTSNSKISNHEFTHMGRVIMINQAASSTAIINFEEFCIKNYSVNDYQIIAQNFSTIFLINIPKLSFDQLDQLKRFSNLIDIFYDYKTNIIFYAECKIEDIYTQKKGGFEFNRIISRIKELQAKKIN
jgi:cell division protein ZapE